VTTFLLSVRAQRERTITRNCLRRLRRRVNETQPGATVVENKCLADRLLLHSHTLHCWCFLRGIDKIKERAFDTKSCARGRGASDEKSWSEIARLSDSLARGSSFM
jgi:hypothetical protein